MKLERRVLREYEKPQHRDARRSLADQRGVSGPSYAPAKLQNEDIVEDGADHRADDHGQKRAVGGARRADEVVHAHADHLQHETEAQDLDERRSVRTHLVGRAREGKERIEQRRVCRDGGDDDPEDNAKRHGVAKADFRIRFAPFAQTQCGKRVAAVADKHRERHEHDHERRRDRCRRQADFPHRLPEEDGVDQVVRRVHQHAQDSGNSELGDEPRKGRRAHAGDAIIALRLARGSSFRRRGGAHRGFGGRFQGLATLFFLCRHMHTSCFNRLICHFSETHDCMHICA